MKHRIVPVISGGKVSFVSQYKPTFISRWRDDGDLFGGAFGYYVDVIYFKSPKKAINWTSKKYGERARIVEYRP